MEFLKNIDKNNLHHAYLIEGSRDVVVPEIIKFIEDLGIETLANPDFCHLTIDSFKIDDARNIKALSSEKGYTNDKKIFLISANSFLLEAQNALLKIFEEPIENTHFFIVIPNTDSLLKTLVSRFYLIKNKINSDIDRKDVEKFIQMDLRNRLDFIKELLTEDDEAKSDKVGSPDAFKKAFRDENTFHDGVRAKAIKFLDSIELVLNEKINKKIGNQKIDYFEHIFKVREFLRQPGSSPKTLMESVALIVPIY